MKKWSRYQQGINDAMVVMSKMCTNCIPHVDDDKECCYSRQYIPVFLELMKLRDKKV